MKNPLRAVAQRVMAPELNQMNESITKLTEAVAAMQAEERGWTNVSSISSQAPWELTGDERRRVIEKTRDAYKRNPMAGQIVDIKRHFTIGQGISFKAEDPEVQEILKAFWQDESNKWFMRQAQLSDDIEIDGEFYLRFFTDQFTGRVKVRCIPAWQITDVLTDPDDAETPVWYKREWTEQRWDPQSKQYNQYIDHTGQNAEYIPAEDVLHMKIGVPLYAKFGHSPLNRVLGYLTAYKDWLEDRAKINKAKAVFAWKKKIKGAARMVQTAAEAVVNGINKVVNAVLDRPEPPKIGGVIVENEGVEWSVINSDVKAEDASEDGRAIKLMICAGSGIFEHWFGDSKISTRAGADSMEIPMLKMFEWRQKLFEETFLAIFRRVIRAAVEAGTLPEKTTVKRQAGGKEIELELSTDHVHIDIDFPPLVDKDIEKLTNALAKQIEIGVKSKQTAALSLGVEDWEQEQAMMQAEYEADQKRRLEDETNKYPAFNPPDGNPEDDEDDLDGDTD
ncbi:hypothetical protein H1S01_03300 [Heliobacterium chlorum]|uniref:Phage portal protein n=1 Tax=Heliobacterium chlorum TaxID=2698 RepID=A0ABR7SYC9_HELCL|nr:hypothetical protein [Heliobacterium chlorum]MBC9783538.1 hypothetical protein [Heliobacterium chlorum]